MKRKNIVSVLLAAMLVFCGAFTEVGSGMSWMDLSQTEATAGKSLLRFHVVANSDSVCDQQIKLLIRDEILNRYGEKLTQLSSRTEAVSYLTNVLAEIEQTACRKLTEYGFSYGAKANIDRYVFPVKSYGRITLPEGRYLALKVILGNGDGKNWWCVMFPPLCFIDITKGRASEQSSVRLEKSLAATIKEHKNSANGTVTNSKGKLVTDTPLKSDSRQSYSKKKPEIRLKCVELIKELFQ